MEEFLDTENLKFLHTENLKLYRKVLDETTDEVKRKSVAELIRNELAKEPKPTNPKDN
ncbi:hypothetical protein BN961_00800 [Afipia felis]|uniref:Uncharacterized protein n=1 Tax=Afipia felis TaxID=1035 RepID=A0A090MIX1_AFIFE|nr:hypothetical protein [Afipia felis]CEG07411.1 hypothetical protein BN961_00800 [Afipia felis]